MKNLKNLPKILARIVPHKKNRNNQVDDYYEKNGVWFFTVSKMNAKYEFLVLMHALIEWFLCMMAGVKERDITNFDKMFEAERADGKWTNEEPGDDPRAPYQQQHRIATAIEMQLAGALGVDWDKYTKVIDSL